MVEKILDFGNLKVNEMISMENKRFLKLSSDLRQIGFFNDENTLRKPTDYNKETYYILQWQPDPNDRYNGDDHIRVDYAQGRKIVHSKTYDFDMNIRSTCS